MLSRDLTVESHEDYVADLVTNAFPGKFIKSWAIQSVFIFLLENMKDCITDNLSIAEPGGPCTTVRAAVPSAISILGTRTRISMEIGVFEMPNCYVTLFMSCIS